MSGRVITPQDCHALINAVVKEVTGQKSTIQAIDTSSFVSAGETALAHGTENTMNALGIVLTKRIIAITKLSPDFALIDSSNSDLFAQIMSKIKYYTREAVASGDWNTQLYEENLKEGAENTSATKAVGSQWEQHRAVPLEYSFAGMNVWQHCITRDEEALKVAFANESNFAAFVSGIMQSVMNEITLQKSAYNRFTALNYIAGIYDMGSDMQGSVVNLTKEFNDKFGTSYTSAELRSTYLDEFLKFMVSKIKEMSDMMAKPTNLFHWTPTKVGYTLIQETSKEDQRLFLFEPLIRDAESWVLPLVFNERYLDMPNFEPVEYWQNPNDKGMIKISPAIPNTANPAEQKKGSEVNTFVVGCLFDKNACTIQHKLEKARTTPVEARKGYMNTWFTFARNSLNDFTYKGIIFVMEDPS